MPLLQIAPADLEFTDFLGGWQPDPDKTALVPNALEDVLNLLPDRATGIIETRSGYSRFSNLLVDDYEVVSIFAFSRHSGVESEPNKRRFVCVLRKKPKPSPRVVDDIQLWSIDIATGTAARFDDAAVRIWQSWAGNHWGQVVDNIFYGGGEKDPMYSFRPYFADGTANPDPYDPDASMGQYTANQWTVGTAYTTGTRVWDWVATEKLGGGLKQRKYVFVCTADHTAATSNRPGSEIVTDSDGVQQSTQFRKGSEKKWENLGRFFPDWVTDTTYKVGDIVSYLVENNQKFPRGLPPAAGARNRRSTFICVREHTAAAGNAPPSGAWEPYRAPVSTVAHFHGNRLFIRDTDAGTGRLRYSEAVTADGFWDQTAWDSDDIQGAGYMDIKSGDGDDIKALQGVNQYLIICKRYSTWALSGMNPSTWTLRPISTEVGALWKRAIVPHEGLVYFLSDNGLMVTDGVTVQEAENNDVIRDWLRDNLDLEDDDGYLNFRIHMVSYLGFIWIFFPGGEKVVRPAYTLVYDPATASWWKLDIKAKHSATAVDNRVERLYFAKEGTPALIMRYAPAANTSQDDTGAAVQAFQDISWAAKTPWLTFSSQKEQRRIRRVWALVKANVKNVTLKLKRNYNDADNSINVTRTTSNQEYNYVEGAAVRDFDPYAVQLEISGTSAPVSVVSAAIQTQFRRKRYNRGPRA